MGLELRGEVKLKIHRLPSLSALKLAFHSLGLKEMVKEKNQDANEKTARGQAIKCCNIESVSEDESARKREGKL